MSIQHRRILIIKPSSLGDIVHALPVLSDLRATWPDAHIAWLVGNSFAPLLEGHPLLDEIILFDRKRYGRMWRSPSASLAFWRFVHRVRQHRFDLVLDLQGLIRSGLMSFFSGARRRLGFSNAREGAWMFYTHHVRAPRALHAVDRNLRFLDGLGIRHDEPAFPLGLRDDEHAAAHTLLSNTAGNPLDEFTAVIPGARWQSKRWSPERIADLIDAIHADGLPQCVLLGAPGEREFTDRVVKACRSDVVDLVGRTTLRQLAAVIDLANRVVCHDSGPMHIAAALNKPTVAIFGPTNPDRTGPYSPAATVVTHPLECAPCYRRICPLGHHDCMRRLDVKTVLAHVRDLDPTDSATAPRPR